MAFGFQDNGTAFIGSASGSQLRFDGNNGVITSSGYLDNNATTGSVIQIDGTGTGLYLDFDKAKIVASKKYLQEGNKPAIFRHITIDADADCPLVIGSKDEVDNGTRFKVAWDGTVEANNGTFKGTINASNGGTIGNWKIEGGNLQSSSGLVTLYGNTGQIDGSKITGATLASNSSLGYITLDGYLKTGKLGYFGVLNSNNPGNETKEGIGIFYGASVPSSDVTAISEVKATENNCGMHHKTTYLSIENGIIKLGGGVIKLDSKSYDSEPKDSNSPAGTEGQIYFQVVGS